MVYGFWQMFTGKTISLSGRAIGACERLVLTVFKMFSLHCFQVRSQQMQEAFMDHPSSRKSTVKSFNHRPHGGPLIPMARQVPTGAGALLRLPSVPDALRGGCCRWSHSHHPDLPAGEPGLGSCLGSGRWFICIL